MATESEIAWAAGYFDSEGCIGLGTESQPTQIRMWLGNTDRVSLDRFIAIVGCGHVCDKSPTTTSTGKLRKPIRYWHTSRKSDVKQLLRLFRPWLGEQRGPKADVALSR